MKQIGTAVLEALKYEGSINSVSSVFRYMPTIIGMALFTAGSGTVRDGIKQSSSRFARSVEASREPRYLLARTFWRFFREDYFAVPDLLARKKDCAEPFARNWRSHVGPVQLVFRRTPDGRKVLLRARMHSFARHSKAARSVLAVGNGRSCLERLAQLNRFLSGELSFAN